jgi:uncharacterized protein
LTQNPFVYDRPLPADQLVDRGEELDQLLRLASAGQSSRVAAPRRFGKTTLLGALAEAAWQVHEMVPAVVDFSRVTSLDDVVVRLQRAYERGLDRGRLRAVWRALRRRAGVGATVGVPGVGEVSATLAPAARPGAALALLHELLELPRQVHERTGQRCLVVFDEFQDLLVAQDDLDGLLRSHLQHHHGVASYVFAGSQPTLMEQLFGDRRRPLFEQARAVRLGPLPGPELGDWLDARLAAAGREALRERVDDLVALAAGHPQRAMLLAHLLFEQDDDDPDALEHALDAAVHEAGDALEQTWRALSVAQRRLLGAVAAGHDRVVSGAALAFTGMGKGSQAKVRDQLVAACHLERVEDGAMRFVDPLFRLWLERR